jgi:outer membrane receptor protein involved in Fe transport
MSHSWRRAAAAFVLAAALAGSAAELRGTVSDNDNRPLAGANVTAKPLAGGPIFGAATDLDGAFRVLRVPAGEYWLSASMVGYAAEEPRLIEVRSFDTVLPFRFELEATAMALEEVVVEGRAERGSVEATLDDRMASATIIDNIGGEQIKRMPDPDVAKVLRRSTGVETVSGDPVIRGLGVRYSKVSLNNAAVSGTEPNRSSVSLSLFPASLMSNLTVSKAYSADQFGEFGGGRVNMDTWELGGAPVLSVSISAGGNSGTTFKDFHSYEGGSLDLLGFDDGSRELPSAIADATTAIVEGGRFTNIGYTAEELAQLSSSFKNNWETKSGTAAPSSSVSASVGNTLQVMGRPVKMLLSGLWSQSSTARAAERFVYKGGLGGQITQQHDYDFRHYSSEVGLGGLAGFTWEGGDWSRYRANLFYNRTLEDETRFFSGWNDDRGKFVEDTRLRFVANSVLSSQLGGHHVLPTVGFAEIDWMLAAGQGARQEPDTREVQYDRNPEDVFSLADETQSGSRIYGDLVDRNFNTTLDLTLPLSSSHDGARFKTGFAALLRHRDSETRFFQFELRDFHDIELSAPPSQIYAPENFHSDGILVREATRPTDSYKADQEIFAGFVMLDLRPADRLRLNAGLRYEHATQTVTSYELFVASLTPVEARIQSGDWLPALNATWLLDESSNLRLALSQTVSRPDFREMSEFEFTDIIGGHAVIGNPDLKRALIQHADLRWERRLGPGDLVSASLFVKRFDDPIEVVIQATAQNRVSYENADAAYNYGTELEWRQQIGQLILLPEDLRSRLSAFSFSANLTLLKSDIALSDSTKGIQSSSNRPLHGQSPYLANLNLSWEHPTWGTTLDLFYHTYGKRIAEVGAKPLPDVYEMPVNELDFAFRQPLGPRLSLRGAVRNLLNPEHRFEQGGLATHVYREGVGWSLGLGWTL